MKSMLLSLFTCLLLAASSQAQQAKGGLQIEVNKNILQPGDSLLVTVLLADSFSAAGVQSLATLELVVENEQGQRTRLRWPMVNGQASGALYLPDSLPRGKYTLLAGVQQRFFEVIGQVREPGGGGAINAMLLTKTGEWAEQEVPLAPDGSFAITNWLFEDNALMAFSGTKDSRRPLDIRISTQLDSSFEPLAVAGRTFYIGNPPSAMRATLSQPVATGEAVFGDRGSLLPAVIVRAVSKSPAQQFNEEYVSGLFRTGDERVISLLDDPAAVGFSNIFIYLQGRVAGLQMTPSGFNGGMATWRGSPVTFFLDEVRVPAQQVANIPITDIALVKAFPPPFLAATGGGGAVAIYTRRGGEANYLPPNRQVFRVRGYTASATVLNMNKLRL